jgi:hypothetical protein
MIIGTYAQNNYARVLIDAVTGQVRATKCLVTRFTIQVSFLFVLSGAVSARGSSFVVRMINLFQSLAAKPESI